MNYYIIAGEASGDLHGSLLIRELKKLDQQADIRCWGGDKMQSEGAVLVKHYRDLAFMGFSEVIKNLRTIFRNLAFCKKDILEYKPDLLVLVDYPGFNLRIAKWAKQQGLRVVYYISPQVWAWKESRVKMMKACIDKMIVILPFEKKYFEEKWDWKVDYVGHPLVDIIGDWKKQARIKEISDNNGQTLTAKPIIAILPGSRKQEILKKLPLMLEVSHSFPTYQFIVAKAPGLEESFYDELLKPYRNVSWVGDKTYDLLSQARAAIVTSGTATLETALFDVPEVVCYKSSWLTYQIGKRVIRVKYISLVNLIMDKPVVKELIQDELTAYHIRLELEKLLHDEPRIRQVKQDYADLRKLLGEGGNAPAKAARIIRDFLAQ